MAKQIPLGFKGTQAFLLGILSSPVSSKQHRYSEQVCAGGGVCLVHM